jgi:hypothetical protein
MHNSVANGCQSYLLWLVPFPSSTYTPNGSNQGHLPKLKRAFATLLYRPAFLLRARSAY